MWMDVLGGGIIAIFMFFGWRWGAWIQVTRLLLSMGAFALALGAAGTTPGLFLKIFPWTDVHAQAWGFVIFFLLFFLLGRFVVERFIIVIDEHPDAPGMVSSLLGAILGAGRGAVVVYAVLASFVLVNRSHGAENIENAVAFQHSELARRVMVENLVDPEGFPHESLFRDLHGMNSNRELTDAQDDLLDQIWNHPKAQFMGTEVEMMNTAMAGNWQPLIDDGRIFELLTDGLFLQLAWDFDGGSFDEFIRYYE